MPIVIDPPTTSPAPSSEGGIGTELRVPRLRVPIEMGGRGLRVVEQDDPYEVAGCVYALLATPRGSRIEEPDYGVEDPTFEQLPLEVDEWLQQIAEFEPRAVVETAQDIDDLTADVRVEVGVA